MNRRCLSNSLSGPSAVDEINSVFTITSSTAIDASHRLETFPGDKPEYGRWHGHTFPIEVTIAGQPDEHGMLIDGSLLDELLSAAVSDLDHRTLNEVPGLEQATAENLVRLIANRMTALLSQRVQNRSLSVTKVSCARANEITWNASGFAG